MKKFILFFSLFLLAVTSNVNAQVRFAGSPKQQGRLSFQNFNFVNGSNTIELPNGAILSCRKTGKDGFSEVVYKDPTGKSFKLAPATPGTNGAPQPSCKFPIPDACFATADKSIGMCICKPTDLSNGTYGVSLLLPAVQPAREAAHH
jgi:hypothetical protein